MKRILIGIAFIAALALIGLRVIPPPVQVEIPWKNVKDFGAVGDNATDNTSAINAAAGALTSGGTVYFPPGIYRYTVLANITTDGIIFECSSPFSTTLRTTSATADTITFATNLGGGIRGCRLDSSVTRTAGSTITVRGLPGVSNVRFEFHGNRIEAPFIGLNFTAAKDFDVRENSINNPINTGIRIENTVNADEGDNFIIANHIGGSTTGVGIRHINGGGLRVVGNNFSRQTIGYSLELASGNTCCLNIVGNGFANETTAAISLTQTLGSFSTVVISGNILFSVPAGIVTSTGSWLAVLSITGNNILIGAAGIGMDLVGGTDGMISGNVIDASNTVANTGIRVGAAAARVHVGSNAYTRFAGGTLLSNAGASNSLELLTAGMPFASLPTVAFNGSRIYCDNCVIANPCAGAGTGAIAKRITGTWVCN